MSKTAVLTSLVVLSAVAGGSFAYGWYRVTGLPAQPLAGAVAARSSEQDTATTSRPTQPEQSSQPTDETASSSQQSIQQQLSNLVRENGQLNLTLDAFQLNQLVSDAILSQPQAAQLFANASSLQTTLNGDLIETGAILNLSELPQTGLPDELQTGLTQLTTVVPMLANRDIYIGIVARPQVQDGQITLGQDLNFKLGQFTLPLADVAEHMGFSISDIEQRLNTTLHQQGLTLENIEILDEQLVITGTRS